LGCRRFRNYKHILQTSLDGQWIDGGEFPLAPGSYATISKSNRGLLSGCRPYGHCLWRLCLSGGLSLRPHSGGSCYPL
jgi:hypothetical protein